MVIPGLLIGGGIVYLGKQVYEAQKQRRSHKQKSFLANISHGPTEATPSHQPTLPAWYANRRVRNRLLIGAGIAAVGGAMVFAVNQGITPTVVVNGLSQIAQQHSTLGPLIYIAAYATLPLFFFPSTLIALTGGSIFGVSKGLLYTIIGSNLSAYFAFRIGRRLRSIDEQGAAPQTLTKSEISTAKQELAEIKVDDEDGSSDQTGSSAHEIPLLKPFIQRLQANPFTTVLTMHCLYLPYEPISYGAGLLGLPEQAFVPATMLGMLPSTVTMLMAGSSVQSNIGTGLLTFNPAALALSGVLLVGSLTLAGYINWRYTSAATQPPEHEYSITDPLPQLDVATV